MRNITIDGVEYTPVIKEEYKRITQLLDFEVYDKDLKEMSWCDLIGSCKELGKGWRLPTKDELNLIYLHKNIIGGFKDDFYCTSSEENTLQNKVVRVQNFMNGLQDIHKTKWNTFNTRPVRDAKTTTNLGTTLNVSGTGTGIGIEVTTNNTLTLDKRQPTIINHLKMLAPIELPTDKEIEESSPHKLGGGNYNSLANFYRYEGAKWMKEQIINQNK